MKRFSKANHIFVQHDFNVAGCGLQNRRGKSIIADHPLINDQAPWLDNAAIVLTGATNITSMTPIPLLSVPFSLLS
jgi:hypothetical protein